MGRSFVRQMASCVLVLLLPAAMFAADSNAAMLYTHGAAWVNGAHVPRASSAIFSGDLLETRSDSIANINSAGSSIAVASDSMVKFEGSGVLIEHGGVTVSTSKGVATTAGDVKVSPSSNSWTEFKVTDVDGTVRIAANKGDLTIFDGRETFTLAQGQETTRDENNAPPDEQGKKKKGNKKRADGAAPAAGGGVLNSPIAVGVGAGAIGGVAVWILIHNDNPASPSRP
jgi:hypothetical protein